MKNKILLLVIVILAVGLSSAYAGNANRIGTAGAQELLIPAGSRGAALGGSVVANSYGVDAIYWNPAGLANLLGGTEAMFTHLPYLADIDVEYAAVGTHIEDFGTIAVSIKAVNIGDIEETTEDFPEGTGRVFSPSLTVLGLTYARVVTSNVNFGITAHVINESIFEVSATGFAFDFGFTYETPAVGLTACRQTKNGRFLLEMFPSNCRPRLTWEWPIISLSPDSTPPPSPGISAPTISPTIPGRAVSNIATTNAISSEEDTLILT